MRCFYVLVHGTLRWSATELAVDAIGADQPDGFWCHRYVLAENEESAEGKALQRVLDNLDREFGWLSTGAALVDLNAEEVSNAPFHKLLKPDNKGHTFYCESKGS